MKVKSKLATNHLAAIPDIVCAVSLLVAEGNHMFGGISDVLYSLDSSPL